MNLHQAYLWIGPEQELIERAVLFIQAIFCANQGCKACSICRSIEERRHHAVTWLIPENTYTVKQLDTLFNTVCFELNPGEHHVIVLERADLLNIASANSLLKSLEEPPAGYHYLLLAPRRQGILSTITSRCVVEQFSSADPVAHRLVPYFTEYQFSQAPNLMKEIEKERIPEREIDQLLDASIHYWHNQYKKALAEGNTKKSTQYSSILATFHAAREKSPMPGSSKLFLKNLFLALSLDF